MHLSRLSIQIEGCLLYREDTWADRSLVIVLHVYYLLLVSKLAYRTILIIYNTTRSGRLNPSIDQHSG